MTNFRFKMQTVLDQKARQEQCAQQQLANAAGALQRAETLMAELSEVRAALLTEITTRHDQSFDPRETQLYQEYMLTIAQSIRDQEICIRDLREAWNAQRERLICASQEKQALENVRDRQRLAHSAELKRTEQKTMDDLITARYHFSAD